MVLKLEQFLARISGRKVSGLSGRTRFENHVKLKGPNKDGPVIRFDIYDALDTKDGTIGFA